MHASSSLSIAQGEPIKIPKKSFFELFNECVQSNRHKQAIQACDENERVSVAISFEELDRISNQIANFLIQNYGSKENSSNVVLVSLKPSKWVPVLLLAILKSGMTYLPITEDFSLERKKHILEEVKPVLIILNDFTNTEAYRAFDFLTDNSLLKASKSESHKLNFSVKYPETALILYTSGSTGKPKGVKLAYSALLNRLHWQWRRFPFEANENCCIFKTALTFVDSVSEMWGALLQGRTLLVVSKETTKNIEKFLSIIEKYEIKRLVLVPSLLKAILNYLHIHSSKRLLPSLRLWVCSGETLQATLVKEFYAYFSKQNKLLANYYGSTEVMGDVTYYLFKEDDPFIAAKKVPIGHMVDNCMALIVNENLEIVPEGETGELIICGDNLADGYIRDDSNTKFLKNKYSSIVEGERMFRTGDYARLENGILYYEGRQDSQVKIRGHRVDTNEVEKAVLMIPNVQDAIVLCNNEGEASLLCYVVLTDSQAVSQAKIIESSLRNCLPDYMVPKIIVIESMPLLVNGKKDRQRLLAMAKSQCNCDAAKNFKFDGLSEEYAAKAQALMSVISSIVGYQNVTDVNFDDNFYEIGGNSLNSVSTVLRLREAGYYIGLTDFIYAKTLKDIMDKMLIEDKVDSKEGACVYDKYFIEMLNDSHKEEVIRIITNSFYKKADLEQWILSEIEEKDYEDLIEKFWPSLVASKLSFVARKKMDREVMSVALNFDADDEPQVEINSNLSIIFSFLEHVELPILEKKLPKGKGKVLHALMMATSDKLDSRENIILMRLMEEEILNIAKSQKFAGIFTTNTSPLTQQLGVDVFKYQVMLDYQVNQYVAEDQSKPFGEAPDSQRVICCWKKI